MVRLLALVCACLFPLAALARPAESGSKDYQTLAEKPPTAAESPSGVLSSQAPVFPAGYSLHIAAHPTMGNDRRAVVTRAGKQILAWDTALPQFFVQRGVLYRAEYAFGSPGCTVVAFDLGSGKEVWRTALRATGVCSFHSFYSNSVRIERFDGDALRVSGRETFGDYVEFVNLKSGKTVGHKVVHPEWMKSPLLGSGRP